MKTNAQKGSKQLPDATRIKGERAAGQVHAAFLPTEPQNPCP